MFGLSFSEIIVIGVLLLVVVGPKQLPEVARTIARFMNEFKRTTSEFTDSFYNIRTDITKSVDQAREKLNQEVGLTKLKEELGSVERDMSREEKHSDAAQLDSSKGTRDGGESGGGSVS